jgi:threonine synthase
VNHVKHLRCLICGKTYQPDEVAYVCPHHGAEGILDVVYDYAAMAQAISPQSLARNPDSTIWRYKPLLPVAADAPVPPLTVGGTPLYAAPRLAAGLGLKHVWVKDDGREPTASFKDRASAVALVKAQEAGAEMITTASTGNAAAALAGLAASIGFPSVIFVPASAPQAKIAQLLTFGATVMLVDGSYDAAFELCMQAADAFGWYNRNTGYNPYMSEGKKTVSYEICEQLGWQAPDVVFVSVGDGCIIGGVYKGFYDLLQLGWIDHMPRIMGVQAQGSNFLAEAWQHNEDVLTKAPIQARTVADSISAGLPRDRLKAMRAVRESDGGFITVSDEAILSAIPELARATGVFAEPAGAAAYAGLRQAVRTGQVAPDERIVVINTGSGLKDVASAMKAAEMSGAVPHFIAPTLEAVRRALNA